MRSWRGKGPWSKQSGVEASLTRLREAFKLSEPKYQEYKDMLTKDELERYDRQIIIRGFGKEGQEKLKKARVFIAGVGGLCSSIATYLTAAGVGVIRLVDHDSVELSNLNRQVLHWNKDIGRSKANSAAEKLKKLNPGVKVEAIEQTITEANISQLVAGFDLIVDAMDNLPTRYLLNKTALEKNLPFFTEQSMALKEGQ